MDYKNKYFKYKYKYLTLKKECIIINQKGSGGRDDYCYLCGAPVDTNGSFTLKNFKKYKKYFDKIYKKNYKGKHSSNQYPNFSEDSILEWIENEKHIPEKDKKAMENDYITLYNPPKDAKKYKWMNDLVLLHWSGMILELSIADTWIQQYTDKSGVEHYSYENTHIVHRDCYKITKLKYGDYTSLNKEFYKNSRQPQNIDYGFIKNYDSQYYNWIRYFYDNIDYVLESPLKNSKNKKRILNINHHFSKKINPAFVDFLSVYKINNKIPTDKKYVWMEKIMNTTWQLNDNLINKYMKYFEKIINNSSYEKEKISSNKKKDRPSPSESATKFKVGTKKKGDDGNMWVIVKNKNGVKRWNKIK